MQESFPLLRRGREGDLGSYSALDFGSDLDRLYFFDCVIIFSEIYPRFHLADGAIPLPEVTHPQF